jgi:hypothetical protein
MKLEYEFTMRATVDPPLVAGPGPMGVRAIFAVTGGEAEGERISGKVPAIGADWGRMSPDGDWIYVDVRVEIETHDGAVIHLEYLGHLEVNEKVGAAMTGESGTDFGDQYFFTQPRLETGDERYAWVNRKAWIGEGHILPGRQVEYRVYRVEND